MRRFLLVAVTVLLLLALCACTGTNDKPEVTTATGTGESTGKDETTGNTETTENCDTTAGDTTGEEETTGSQKTDGMRAGGTVRVVSYNIDANLDTLKSRAKGLCSILLSLDADSIGVQEARPGWVRQFDKLLTGYDYIGVSADGEKPNEWTFGTYIYYKKDKYNVVDSGTFWLSKTPDVPSRYGDTVDCNRTCCWVILEDKETGFRYVHMNSHLDWMDPDANAYQVEMIRRQIRVFEEMGLPVFATGDYNADEGTRSYQLMLQEASIGDAKYQTEDRNNIGTYPSYGEYDVTKEKPIDFCFVTKNLMQVNKYRVVDEKYEDQYVSDHFGLCIEATIPELPDSYATADAPTLGEVRIDQVGETDFTVHFAAATGKTPVVVYTVVVTDSEGNEVFRKELKSGFRLPTPPTEFSCMASGLNPDSTYEVSVTATNLFGKTSEKATVSQKTNEEKPAEPMDPADLFDLALSDTWKDASAKNNDIQSTGTPSIVDRNGSKALDFDGRSYLKVPGIKDVYETMRKGFTFEVDFEMKRTSGTPCLVSNMQAGGFGFEFSNGEFFFNMHCEGNYAGVGFKPEIRTRYHVVVTYDGELLTMYVNGVRAASKQVGGNLTFATAGSEFLCIGGDSGANGTCEWAASAYIYHVRLYSAVASSGQVKLLYEANKQ